MRQQAVDEIVAFLQTLPELASFSVRPWPEDPQRELARCLQKGQHALYVQWIRLSSEKGEWNDRRSTMQTRCEFYVQFRFIARCRDAVLLTAIDDLRARFSGYIPPVLQTHPDYHPQEPGFRHILGETVANGEGYWDLGEEYMIPLWWRRKDRVELPGRPGL